MGAISPDGIRRTPGRQAEHSCGRKRLGAMADVVTNQVSVRDLKAHLSLCLARAQAGEVMEVTSHRRPIARITPVVPPRQAGVGQPLHEAITNGLVSWSGQKPVFAPPIQLPGQGTPISTIVIQDRG